MVKLNIPVTLMKYEPNCKTGKKESGNDHALAVTGMLWNC